MISFSSSLGNLGIPDDFCDGISKGITEGVSHGAVKGISAGYNKKKAQK